MFRKLLLLLLAVIAANCTRVDNQGGVSRGRVGLGGYLNRIGIRGDGGDLGGGEGRIQGWHGYLDRINNRGWGGGNENNGGGGSGGDGAGEGGENRGEGRGWNLGGLEGKLFFLL